MISSQLLLNQEGPEDRRESMRQLRANSLHPITHGIILKLILSEPMYECAKG